jgi:hypothetical protein
LLPEEGNVDGNALTTANVVKVGARVGGAGRKKEAKKKKKKETITRAYS